MSTSLPEFFGADYGNPEPVTPERDSGPSIGPEFTCPYCEAELTYGGRGRKPKYCTPTNGGNPQCEGPGMRRGSSSGTGTRRNGKATESALAVMDGTYDQILQALLVISPDAASEMERRLPKQQERNRVAFDANPALAQRVASWGGKGGTTFFVLSNLAFLAAIVRVAAPDARNAATLLSAVSPFGSSEPKEENVSRPLFAAFGVNGVPA